jgi:hypothetical protein
METRIDIVSENPMRALVTHSSHGVDWRVVLDWRLDRKTWIASVFAEVNPQPKPKVKWLTVLDLGGQCSFDEACDRVVAFLNSDDRPDPEATVPPRLLPGLDRFSDEEVRRGLASGNFDERELKKARTYCALLRRIVEELKDSPFEWDRHLADAFQAKIDGEPPSAETSVRLIALIGGDSIVDRMPDLFGLMRQFD